MPERKIYLQVDEFRVYVARGKDEQDREFISSLILIIDSPRRHASGEANLPCFINAIGEEIEMRKSFLILIFFVIIGGVFSTSFGSMYIWTDENGVKHYSNTPPPQDAGNVKEETEIVSKESADNQNEDETGSQRAQDDDSVEQPKSCSDELDSCREYSNDIYESEVERVCEGDWSNAAAYSKAVGKGYTAREYYEACVEEREEERDKRLKGCEKSYQECVKE
ncbi:MAG: DUF4124 domain-containing protein [Desulfobacterales bacterium]|nr:DUF4124 domain-containing protein [Desulfobacterales bacterium]